MRTTEISFWRGWLLLPSGFALPDSEFPRASMARHLVWIDDNTPVTPWAWRKVGDDIDDIEVANARFEGEQPRFDCTCHKRQRSSDDQVQSPL
jgi:hypothetical protein